MKFINKLSMAFIGLVFCLAVVETTFAQGEKLGDIKYTAPKGWTKTAKEYAVVFNEIDQAKGNFCFITLYAASTSEGTAQKDFATAWKTRVVEPWGGEANPKTVTEPDDGWTAIAAGAQIDFQGNRAFAFLTVVSGFGKTVSILGILNDDSYLPPLQAFVEKIDIDKTPVTVTTTATTTTSASAATFQRDAYDRIIIPPPTRQLTIADLVGQWGEASSFHQRYVYRSSGNYAGSDSLTMKSKMTLTADGGFFDDFYMIQNGKLIKEKTGGSFAINGRILAIKQNNLAKYVIRGWLELPDMTVLEVCGPWYDDQPIPAEIFNNPVQGANLNQQWVRKK
ncbi:MAG: hypothetical protein WBD16_08265 [Pyrinomonadaceae bacterium]